MARDPSEPRDALLSTAEEQLSLFVPSWSVARPADSQDVEHNRSVSNLTIMPSRCLNPSRYPLSNFTFSTKEAQPEEDPSVAARLQRLQNNYEDFGMRRTVEGILVVHDHGHPHILMLQIANAFFKL